MCNIGNELERVVGFAVEVIDIQLCTIVELFSDEQFVTNQEVQKFW